MQVSGTVFSQTTAIPLINIVLLLTSCLLVTLLAVILFPFLWKD
jgi:heme exporter protein B